MAGARAAMWAAANLAVDPVNGLHPKGASLMASSDRSPALYPIRFDPQSGAVQWLRLDEAQYRTASFLDERLLQTGPLPAWADWSTAARASAGLDAACHFIFHIGHVGSTLLSRLLGEHPGVMSLREPAILRTLAAAYAQGSARGDLEALSALDVRTDVFLRLFSRTWRPEQTALIKATSFVSGMADNLLARVPQARAICLTVTPMAYIRGILGGPARTEAPLMAAGRLERLGRRLGAQGWSLASMSPGECVAMSWLCEMTALHDATKAHPNAVLWFDFDQLLAAPQAALAASFAHLGLAADGQIIEAILRGPIRNQYSKSPDHAFDAQARRDVLMQAEHAHGAEVRRGMDWLGRTAQTFPAARAVLIDASRIRL
jgi:hypothetical protein